MGRAPCCDKANVKKGPWSPEEDATLKAYIEKYGTGGNWIALPHKIGLKRCGKSCRLRWLNYLRPNIKHGGFTEEEDNIICSLYISIGSRWSIIAAQLPGRTDNDIKNYWNTRLKKKLLGRRKQSTVKGRPGMNLEANAPQDVDSSYPPELSNSALERLQLHMQLQTLENPMVSNFYNNPAIWPKLHPLLQEKLIQGLNFLPQQTLALEYCEGMSGSRPENEPNGDFYSPTMTSIHPAFQHDSLKVISEKIDNLKSNVESATCSGGLYADDPRSLASLASFNSMSSSSDGSAPINYGSSMIGLNINQISDARKNMTELEIMARQEQAALELDYFKELSNSNGSNDSVACWTDDFQIGSAQSDSWDTTSGSIRHEELF